MGIEYRHMEAGFEPVAADFEKHLLLAAAAVLAHSMGHETTEFT
jgi:hypothetical protein